MGVLNVAVNIVAYDLTGGAIRAMAGDLEALGQSGVRAMSNLKQGGDDANNTMMELKGSAIGAGLAFALFAAGTAAGISGAGDLQMGLQRLELATQSTAGAFPKLEAAVVDMANHSLYSTQDTTAAFEKLSEMGFKAQNVMYGFGPAAEVLFQGAYNSTQALQGLGRQALAVGEAMQVGAVEGATLLGSALNTFKSEGLSAATTANDLVGAFYNGVPSATELQQAIEQAGGTASSSGVKFKDFVVTLDLLGQAGLSGSSAGASLSYMLRSLDNPTTKQAKVMEELGITTAKTGVAMDTFRSSLAATGSAGATASAKFDGSVTGLQALYKAGQAASIIPLDTSFNLWATSAGLLGNKLFDAGGNFIGFQGAIDVLDQTMGAKSLTMQEKMQIIGDLFNVRSGRAALLLTNLKDFDTQYKNIWNRIGSTDALSNAQKMLNTFNGAITTLKTTLTSALSEAFLPVVDFLAHVAQGLNNLVSRLMAADPWVKTLVASFLIFGTILGAVVTLAIVGVLIALSPLAPLFGALVVAFGMVVAGAAFLAAGFMLISTHAKQFHDIVDPLIHAVENFAGGLMTRLGPALTNVANLIMWLVNTTRPIWELLWNNFTTILRVAWDIIVGIVKVAGSIIQGFIFVFLDIIGGKWGKAWTDIQTMARNVWNALVEMVTNIGHTILDAISRLLSSIWSTVQNGMHNVQQGFAVVWLLIQSKVREVATDIVSSILTGMNNFVQAIAGAVGNVGSAIGGIVNAIKQAIMNVVSAAAGWGGDLIKNLAGGITGGIGVVTGAVGNVASAIGNFLHHSKPDEGPLADDDMWMGDMMQGWAGEIVRHTPTVANAARGVASAIQSSVNTPALAYSGYVNSGGGSSNGNTTVNFVMDGKTLYQAVIERATGKLKQAGASRQYR